MASIERTAYPRFKRFMSARELHVFYTPQPDEIVWAREAASSDEHLLALVTQLKAFNRLGYFPVLNEVPAEVVGHIRRDLRLPGAPCRSALPRAQPSGTAIWSGPAARWYMTRRVPGRSPLMRSRRLPDGRMTRPI